MTRNHDHHGQRMPAQDWPHPAGDGACATIGHGQPAGTTEASAERTQAAMTHPSLRTDPVADDAPRWSSTTKMAVAIGMVVTAAIVGYVARGAITLVALSALLAFLVAPLVRLLHRRFRWPRWLALATGYAVVMLGVVLIGLVVTLGAIDSVSEIDPLDAVETLRTNAIDILEDLESVSLFGYTFDLTEVVSPLIESLQDAESASNGDGDPAGQGDSTIILGRDQFSLVAGSAVGSLRTVGGLLVATVLSMLVTLLIAFYLNADSHRFHAGLLRYVPEGYQRDAERLIGRINRIWKGYIYGQLLNSLATGLLVWLVLWLIGLPGAFVLGVIMALLNMIPTFGPVLAAVPGVLSAFALGSTRLDMSNLTFTLLVLVVYVVVVQAQANVMAPLITGKAVSMSPAAILIGLIVGVQVAGLVGALLVVPVMASGKEVTKYLMAKLVDRDPFDNGPDIRDNDAVDAVAHYNGDSPRNDTPEPVTK
jgi:predicted PurR-regulated permease PerM